MLLRLNLKVRKSSRHFLRYYSWRAPLRMTKIFGARKVWTSKVARNHWCATHFYWCAKFFAQHHCTKKTVIIILKTIDWSEISLRGPLTEDLKSIVGSLFCTPNSPLWSKELIKCCTLSFLQMTFCFTGRNLFKI